MDKTFFPRHCVNPDCIADPEEQYCIFASKDPEYYPDPELAEGVGAAVIPGSTITLVETPKTPVEANDTITFPSAHGLLVGEKITIEAFGKVEHGTITEIVSTTQVKYEAVNPEKYMKRWTDSWLEGIDYKKSTKPVTGRRQFRNNRAGDGKVRKLPRVRGCGHALDLKKQPRHRNCKSCWTAFFRNQDAMAENIAKIIVEQGQYRVAETFGRKFLKCFHEYCILVERVEALRKAYEEQANVERISRELAIDGAEGSIQPFGGDAEVSIEVG